MESDDTRALYERFPYPAPDSGAPLIADTAIGVAFLLLDDRLDGWEVLDLGCGTGHRLVPLARQYPRARFTGVDASANSLTVARQLAERHGANNVRFVHGSVPDVTLRTSFDLIVSTGVLHHLSNPDAGLAWAIEQLADDGVLYLWFYGALGEHQRMLDRELVRLLATAPETGPDLATVRALGLRLSSTRYGAAAAGEDTSEEIQSVLDADAYLNPIVKPMTFAEVVNLFRGHAVDWLAAFGVNVDKDGKLIDLIGLEPNRRLTVRNEDLFADPELRRRYAALSPLARVRVVELRLRPTGITVIAGRGRALENCYPRVAGNILGCPAPAGVSPVSLQDGNDAIA